MLLEVATPSKDLKLNAASEVLAFTLTMFSAGVHTTLSPGSRFTGVAGGFAVVYSLVTYEPPTKRVTVSLPLSSEVICIFTTVPSVSLAPESVFKVS